jgi:hypothetical protein
MLSLYVVNEVLLAMFLKINWRCEMKQKHLEYLLYPPSVSLVGDLKNFCEDLRKALKSEKQREDLEALGIVYTESECLEEDWDDQTTTMVSYCLDDFWTYPEIFEDMLELLDSYIWGDHEFYRLPYPGRDILFVTEYGGPKLLSL